ncbi:signal peptidase II [Candidatus Woesearchaeota archaeon]|nr:signal peptidase II [Candidatus Woesearchaeota archaeon]
MKIKYIILIIILIILDQVTKFYFGYVHNKGSAFGMFKDYSLFLTIFSIIALVVFSYLFFRFKKYKIALSFALAGITGNLIDRLFLGYVRDFIDIKIIPVFNFADAYLNIALGLYILFEVLDSKYFKSKKSK